MGNSPDKDFLALVDSFETLDKRVSSLAKTRKMFMGLHAFGMVIFFFSVFATIRKDSLPGFMVTNMAIMLMMSLHTRIQADSAMNEIRTLLTFKKLRELSSTP